LLLFLELLVNLLSILLYYYWILRVVHIPLFLSTIPPLGFVINRCFIVVLTRKRSESQFNPRRVLTSGTILFLVVFINTRSIWFTVVKSGDVQVPLWILLCWNWELMTVRLFSIAKLQTNSPFGLITLVNKILSHERFILSNVTIHAESKYAIKIFPSPTVFV
jgi:hypothetical protein